MALFLQYLKQRRRAFGLGLIFCGVFCISFWLYRLPLAAVLYPTLLCAGMACIALALDFLRVRRKHEALRRIQTISDVLSGNPPPADSIQSADDWQIIRRIAQEHRRERAETDRRYADMIDYYTVWAHQIKTPIASMRLHLQNEDSPRSRTLSADLHRIEQYVEMVLAFLRLGSESTDYLIQECDLDSIVKQAVRRFSSEFIGRKLRLDYAPIHLKVITDEKWLCFVIEQILSNALKYTPSGGICITLEGKNTLRIRDTGIGIAPEDLPRIFENGYTGYNGRADKRASGIGLYLCKRICDNLGHGISAQSTLDEGTAIDLCFDQPPLERE